MFFLWITMHPAKTQGFCSYEKREGGYWRTAYDLCHTEEVLCVGFLAVFISSPKNYLSYSPFSIALIIPFFFFSDASYWGTSQNHL